MDDNDSCDAMLPQNALAVWQAYQAMGASKQRHFDCLKQLEIKYEKYGQPTAGEKARLAELLEQHDARVGAFKKALIEIKISDPSAYGAIVRKLSEQV